MFSFDKNMKSATMWHKLQALLQKNLKHASMEVSIGFTLHRCVLTHLSLGTGGYFKFKSGTHGEG